MKATEILEGLNILNKYAPSSDKYWIRFEHDEIFAGDESWPVTEEDKKQLEELNWRIYEDSWYKNF